MAEIIPFKGVLYNMSKVSGEDVIAPPYDIIAPEYKEKLYSKSPYNSVRIDLGKELEGENAKLKKLLAEAHLDMEALKTAFGVKR